MLKNTVFFIKKPKKENWNKNSLQVFIKKSSGAVGYKKDKKITFFLSDACIKETKCFEIGLLKKNTLNELVTDFFNQM